jgi:hypothetical protein
MVGNGTGLAVNTSAPYKQLLKYFEDANTIYTQTFYGIINLFKTSFPIIPQR